MHRVRGDVDKRIPHIKDQMDRSPAVIEQALGEVVQQGKIDGHLVTTANQETYMVKGLKDFGFGDLIHEQQFTGPGFEAGEQHQETLSDYGLLPFAPLDARRLYNSWLSLETHPPT